VLDTQAWLDLLVFDDPRVDALRTALQEGAAVALMDPRMHAELVRVLGYPALSLDAARAAVVARDASLLSQRVDLPDPLPAGLPRCRDPDDQMFVELAIIARVDALLSRDRALLRMARRLRREGIEVLEPADWRAAPAPQISKR
jgi:putative PIN family toxin of toxin-antitoxin system